MYLENSWPGIWESNIVVLCSIQQNHTRGFANRDLNMLTMRKNCPVIMGAFTGGASTSLDNRQDAVGLCV